MLGMSLWIKVILRSMRITVSVNHKLTGRKGIMKIDFNIVSLYQVWSGNTTFRTEDCLWDCFWSWGKLYNFFFLSWPGLVQFLSNSEVNLIQHLLVMPMHWVKNPYNKKSMWKEISSGNICSFFSVTSFTNNLVILVLCKCTKLQR